MTQAALQSLTERVTPVEAGDHVVHATFLGRDPVLVLADGTLVFAEIGEERREPVLGGAGILCAASAANRLVLGGDDGRVLMLETGRPATEIAPAGGAWIDAIAVSAAGAVAWSSGKTVQARDDRGGLKSWTAPSSVRGLAFAPKGYRIAVSHYNGVSFWFPNTSAAPEFYEWKGSHLDVTVSPDGRFIVSSMQDNMLHGWTVADKKHMRMSGYPSKTRSFSWSPDDHWLATSGADAAIVWPFATKDGPMGKAPRECGIRPAKVSCVSFHPKALVLAIGYEDGCILLCRLTDAGELLVHPAVPGSGITALAWDVSGARLLYGAEDGAAGILTLPGS